MAFFSGLVVGLFIGAFCGIVAMCVLEVESDREEQE